jgi:hypothetical protein
LLEICSGKEPWLEKQLFGSILVELFDSFLVKLFDNIVVKLFDSFLVKSFDSILAKLEDIKIRLKLQTLMQKKIS